MKKERKREGMNETRGPRGLYISGGGGRWPPAPRETLGRHRPHQAAAGP
jgi:hypothetical protein